MDLYGFIWIYMDMDLYVFCLGIVGYFEIGLQSACQEYDADMLIGHEFTLCFCVNWLDFCLHSCGYDKVSSTQVN
jgi:hypothetical protein